MIVPAWKNRREFEAWWRLYSRDVNLLAVKDPAEWERVAALIEAFQVKNRGY